MATRRMVQDFTKTKLIVVLGSTATGKSKLGIELAKAFHGEVISADSMQVYTGLDVITNKVTAEESEGIKHHLIDVVSPQKEFTVIDFKKRALRIIEDLSVKGKVPIIVGGTNYFIESLLWDFSLEADSTMLNDVDDDEELDNRKSFQFDKRQKLDSGHDSGTGETHTLSLFEQLLAIDPERANQLHPNNVRKISRSLQVFYSTGKTHSKLLEEQKQQIGSSSLSGPVRFPNSLVFWLTAEQDVLDERISTRVDSMVEKGLLEEIKTFYQKHIVKAPQTVDKDEIGYSKHDHGLQTHKHTHQETVLCKSYEEGLFQAIGFKEFHAYLTCDNNEKERDKHLADSLQRLKQITVRYSKKQKRWVRNRFLIRPKESRLPIYALDATQLSEWHINVLKKAKDITSAFMTDVEIPYSPVLTSEPIINTSKHERYVCEVCENRVIIGDDAWNAHRQSRKHKNMKARRMKLM